MKVGDFDVEDIFDKLSAVTGISKYSGSEVITPAWVVKDMVDLLPPEVFAPDSRFLDPAVKSGRFLVELYNRLMASPLMVQAFPNQQDRHGHIIHNQLYGVATSGTAATIVRKQLYDDPTISGNIVYTADKVTKELIQGAFGDMKFDVVIGNPPYNNDIYLDFVTLGHNLASKYTCMITPAKWQAKGGKKNDDFRKNIVPYMSKIVFYPETEEVFSIHALGGISYYLIDKIAHNKKEVVNICKSVKDFNNVDVRPLCDRITLYNAAISIVNKIHSKIPNIYIGNKSTTGKYKVNTSHLLNTPGTGTFTKQGNLLVVCPLSIDEFTISGNYFVLYQSDSEQQCESFKSFIDTKFVRFLIFIGVCSGSLKNIETWRFVPDPGALDHIFTDQELYAEYKLTEDEIKIIESVIKERK